MKIYGLMIVRNEADILRTNLVYHLALGIDRLLVVDNGSSDGTDRVLRDLSQDRRISYIQDNGPYKQSEVITELALEAYLQGADWVVPIDADEFWCAPGGDFRDILQHSEAGGLRVEVVNYIQRRDQRDTTKNLLLSMTRRVQRAVGPLERVREMVKNREFAFVEVVYAPKWVSRASLGLRIGVGNHEVNGVWGPLEATDRILCLHAPLRSRSVFEAQVANAKRAVEGGNLRVWHWIHWQGLAEMDGLDLEWRANSYEDGCLDVYGVTHPVIVDCRLRDLVAPWIGAQFEPESETLSPSLMVGLRSWACEPELVRATLARMSRIEGWLTEREAMLLMAAAALALINKKPYAVVEIGSYCGRSTVVLGSVLKVVESQARVHAIDPHEGDLGMGPNDSEPTLARFLQNVEEAGVANAVRTIRQHSYKVTWHAPISLLFIDGLHDYENVSRDFTHFQKWVVPSGYVAFHDYDPAYPGVMAFVDELLSSSAYRRCLKVGSLILMEKIGAMSDNNDTDSKLRELAGRVARQEEGVSVLRDVLWEVMSRCENELGERDRRIIDLQQELFAKVSERDEIIRNLQAELHEKVGEAHRIIRDLQTELQTRVGERDEMIRSMQAEFRHKIDDRDEIIRNLQKTPERGRHGNSG